MSNIATALSGLQNVSQAIDTVSNNIANANTIGYKSGEYVFATQFLNGSNSSDQPATGQGSQTLGVRRAMTRSFVSSGDAEGTTLVTAPKACAASAAS